MSVAQELEKLVVRLTGDGMSYARMLDTAVTDTYVAAAKIDRTINNQIVKAGDQLKSVGKSMRNYGLGLTFGVSLPILGTAAAIIKMGADAETTSVQFNTMLGKDQGQKMLKNLREFAASTPFRFPELAGSAKTLIGFGVAQEDVMDTMKVLGDVSAGTGKNVQELAVIFGQIRGMGRLQGQDFMQLVNAGFPVSEIAKTIGTDMKGLKDQMEAGNVSFEAVEETFKRLTREGGKFNNMMKALSETTAGKFSTLMDNITMLGQSMSKYLLPSINKFLDWAINAVQWFDKLDPAVHRLTLIIGGLVGAFGPLLVIVGMFMAGIGGFMVMLTSTGPVVAAFITTLIGVSLFMAKWVLLIGVATKATKALTDHIYGEGSFAWALGKAKHVAMDFAWNVIGFLLNIRENFGAIMNWLKHEWKNLLKDMGNLFLTLVKNNIHNMGVLVHTIVRLYVLLQGYLFGIFKQIFSIDFLNWVRKGVIEAAEVFTNFAKKAWETLKSIFTGENANALSDMARNLAKQLGEDFKAGMNTDDFLGEVKNILGEQAKEWRTPFEGFESSMKGLPWLETGLGSFGEKVPEELRKEADKIMEAVKKEEKKIEDEQNTRDVKTGEFKQMALNRFSVTPVGMYNLPAVKKQEVTDKGVQGKLDELINVTQNQGNKPAVMAR